jgi:hypothetical protein
MTKTEMKMRDTSRNQVPALIKQFSKLFNVGSINLDFGGGKYDKATEYFKSIGVNSFVYDRFGRTDEHNTKAWENTILLGKCDTITCCNVLNVIKNDSERELCVQELYNMVSHNYLNSKFTKWVKVYISIYNGKCKKVDTDIQVCKPRDFYMPMLLNYFQEDSWNCFTKGNFIWFEHK